MSAMEVARPPRGIRFDDSGRARVVKTVVRAGLYALMAVIGLVVAFPLFWMISTSFKSKVEIYITPPTLLPTMWTLNNYVDLFTITKFGAYYRNSVIVAVSVTLISITVG